MAGQRTLHLVGVGVGHSIAPPMHNHIAKSLGLPWAFHATECASLDELVALARTESTVGLVVTMPYKTQILSRLDDLDDLALTIGACNNVYRDPISPGRLRGTNTDWLGIKGCLLEGQDHPEPVLNKPALIVGAGGASRAAIYALSTHFKASVIYILNRDDNEVAELARDAQRIQPTLRVVHIKEEDDIARMEVPIYVVGTVPDLEAKTPSEIMVHTILGKVLGGPQKGVLLDMCFKPRRTRMIKLAEKHGWTAVEGTHVIGHQIETQWKLWAGEDKVAAMDRDGAWKVLLEMAQSSPGINF